VLRSSSFLLEVLQAITTDKVGVSAIACIVDTPTSEGWIGTFDTERKEGLSHSVRQAYKLY